MKYSFALLLLSSSLLASIGKVTALKGSADLERGVQHIDIKVGTKLEEHDKIKTSSDSKLQIVFNDKTVISLGQKSEFSVEEYLFEDKNVQAKFAIGKGFFKSITGKIGKIAPSHFKVKTANATIGVRGTTIIAEISEKLDIIACTYGQIVVSSAKGSVIVNQGERTVVAHAKAPVEAQKVNKIILRQLEHKTDPAAVEQKAEEIPSQQTAQQKEIKQSTQEKKEEQKFPLTEEETTTLPQTTLADIQHVIGTQKPVYEGKVTQGFTSYGAIRDDISNNVRLGFDLGAGTMEGNMQFSDTIQQYDIDIAGRVKDDATFEFNSQNGYNGGGNGILSGEKYEHANGSFTFEEEDLFNQHVNKIEGAFETKRK